ncbi:methylmalonic aciduria type A homolog, mitochondrial-like [Paramacrobiotus metropolitanus]|uniref:methylmalonic aciduria type A homolog, mitochondrial-like n=1 Tax=Paramacrobiotus metropolitanus TaxID=2943436 RepID=UPI002445B4BE|nr:methylmalonic aciduria type A homolog, mitochondrial-like [Paramacrobiotus metropolitanus]
MHRLARALWLIPRCLHPQGPIPRRYSTPSAASSSVDSQVQRLLDGVLQGQRWALAEAITLVESTRAAKQQQATALLTLVLAEQQRRLREQGRDALSLRIGVSGSPGAGKSTFLECLGSYLANDERNHKVACLTIDPSSRITGGSLLGDKTRMANLSRNPRAFIRPSPSSGALGGVTRTTAEAILLCEAAGYDVVFVETVGSGQNEYVVADMVDVFVLIVAPGGGDELQAMKRGIMELCDVVVVNKADGDLLPAARRTQSDYISALKFLQPRSHSQSFPWRPKVVRVSSVTGEGMEKAWSTLEEFRGMALESGHLEEQRRRQNLLWMWRFVNDHLQDLFRNDPAVQRQAAATEHAVLQGTLTPLAGAQVLMEAYYRRK